MLQAQFVSHDGELIQIANLSGTNHVSHLPDEIKASEGFVTWSYTPEVLRKLHDIHPSIIVKDGDRVVGYALVLLPESTTVYEPLKEMLAHFSTLTYRNKPLLDHRVYFMGQICVDKDYRGQGVVDRLYQFHRQAMGPRYDLLVTEIATRNTRSMRAHQKVGFITINTYKDAIDEWNVVLWDWV